MRPRSLLYLVAPVLVFTLITIYYVQQTDSDLASQWAPWLDSAWRRPVDDFNRSGHAQAILDVKTHYSRLYPGNDWYSGRDLNAKALQRLADCFGGIARCEESEYEVIILGSMHFGLMQHGGSSGETIWAMSTFEALTTLNHTLLYAFGHMDVLFLYQALASIVSIPVVIMDAAYLDRCISRSDSNYRELESAETYAPGDWQTGVKGCVRRKGFEEGIPVWKLFAWHFWPGSRSPLGARHTLSPMNYSVDNPDDANFFLGYSIESRCETLPLLTSSSREHRGLVLGKKYAYYSGDNFAFPGILSDVVNTVPQSVHARNVSANNVAFKLVGTVDWHGTLPEGVDNLGLQSKQGFYDVLSRSKAMVGIGNPLLSPSPYDALCCGVPFINPILNRDESKPDDRSLWQTQHDALKDLQPPHVYHVMRGDAVGLSAALRSSVETPIGRFIPAEMTRVSVLSRHIELIANDWQDEAQRFVHNTFLEQGKDFPFLL